MAPSACVLRRRTTLGIERAMVSANVGDPTDAMGAT
jgi:hypothetical protein